MATIIGTVSLSTRTAVTGRYFVSFTSLTGQGHQIAGTYDRDAALIWIDDFTAAADKAGHKVVMSDETGELLGEQVSDRQLNAWFARHTELGTDTSRNAYPMIAYRRADEVEAYADAAAHTN